MYKKLLFVFFIITSIQVAGFAQESHLIWNGNSDQLLKLLLSENEKDNVVALQIILTHIENIDTKSFSYYLYDLFRNHKNDKIRKMALVTLHKTKHYFAMQKLAKDYYIEKNPEIKKLIAFILDEIPILTELN